MPPAKVCPRCGAQYQNLKSTTCPQCFAILVSVDDATAEELAAARREVEESSEFQEVKAADDERFKEQSFGACLGVVIITFVTLLLAVILIVLAMHRHSNNGGVIRTGASPPTAPAPQNWGGGALSVLPVAAATLDEVLPPTVAPYRRISADNATVLTGTLTPIFHAAYSRPGTPLLDVYALPAGRPTPEQNEFRLGLTLASQVGGQNRPLDFFSTEYWHFAVLASPGQTAAPAEVRAALIAQYRQP